MALGWYLLGRASGRNNPGYQSTKPKHYRHVKVKDKVDKYKNTRSITVECPLEYPGLTEKERRQMYEGLAMVADAFREADARCEKDYYKKQYGKRN